MKTLLVAMTAMMLSATDPGRFDYPAPHKSDVVEDHFGHKIADPYRGLEDPNSAETQAWVAAENKVTFDYLATIPSKGAAPYFFAVRPGADASPRVTVEAKSSTRTLDEIIGYVQRFDSK